MAAVASLVTGVVASLAAPSPDARAVTSDLPSGVPITVATVADAPLEEAEGVLAAE